MQKSAISFLMLSALLLSAVSCSGGETAPETTDTQEMSTAVVSETETSAPTFIDTCLPDGLNFNGYEYRIFSYTAFNDPSGTGTKYLNPDAIIGDTVHDAAYHRNRNVEDRLNVKISFVPESDPEVVPQLLNAIRSGDDVCDIAVLFAAWNNGGALLEENALMNLAELPYMNPYAEYYYSELNRDLTVKGTIYYGMSCFATPGMELMYMIFNKNLAASLDIEYPYRTVFDGKWTVDAFLSCIKGASEDLDGDGVFGDNDQFGYRNGDTLTNYMVFGSDIKMLLRTEDDVYTPNLEDTKIINVFQKHLEFKNNTQDAQILKQGQSTESGAHVFTTGKVLFTTNGTGGLVLRDIENFDFGIVPYPKYDEAQEHYYAYAAPEPFCVPTTVRNTEAAGAVTEALTAASYVSVEPAFIDIYIQEKMLRDEESIEIFKMLQKTPVMDVTRYYDFCGGQINPVFLLGKIKDAGTVSSKLASLQKSTGKSAAAFFGKFGEK